MPARFWVSPRMETSHPLSATCSDVWPTLQQKRGFLCLSGVSCISVRARRHLSCLWAPLSSLAVVFIPPIRFLCILIRSSWAFSSWGWTVPALSLSSYVRCSRTFIVFTALCCTPSSMSTSLLSWGARSWAQHSRGVSAVLSRELGVPAACGVLTVTDCPGINCKFGN